MGIIIDVVQDDTVQSLTILADSPVDITDNSSEAIDINDNTGESTVIEVPQGLPGVQNLYVGYDPPSNPQEGWVWIDLNG